MAMIEEEPIELELGLSLGGNYATTPRRTTLQKSGPGSADLGSGFSGTEDLKNKREVNALRRLEARKKRDEKQLKRTLSKGILAGGCSPASFAVYLSNGGGEGPEYKRSKLGIVRSDSGSCPNPDDLQLGFGQNGVTAPSWFAAVGGETERSVVRPVARFGFRGSFRNDSEQNGGAVVRSNGSTVCSSGSDNRSSSRDGGGSIESRSNSIQSVPVLEQSITFAKEESKSDNEGTNNTSSIENPERPTGSKEINQGKLIPAKNNVLNQNQNPGAALPYMPCVSTTGNGLNGKTVHGFLYRYAKGEEVSIVCVCHGSSFSPAEFVQHAGGVDVSNPLRHITVVPSAF